MNSFEMNIFRLYNWQISIFKIDESEEDEEDEEKKKLNRHS